MIEFIQLLIENHFEGIIATFTTAISSIFYVKMNKKAKALSNSEAELKNKEVELKNKRDEFTYYKERISDMENELKTMQIEIRDNNIKIVRLTKIICRLQGQTCLKVNCKHRVTYTDEDINALNNELQ